MCVKFFGRREQRSDVMTQEKTNAFSRRPADVPFQVAMDNDPWGQRSNAGSPLETWANQNRRNGNKRKTKQNRHSKGQHITVQHGTKPYKTLQQYATLDNRVWHHTTEYKTTQKIKTPQNRAQTHTTEYNITKQSTTLNMSNKTKHRKTFKTEMDYKAVIISLCGLGHAHIGVIMVFMWPTVYSKQGARFRIRFSEKGCCFRHIHSDQWRV